MKRFIIGLTNILLMIEILLLKYVKCYEDVFL